MKPVISVECVSKRFSLGEGRSGSGDLREVFSPRFRHFTRRASEFWALQDVSFSIDAGEAVGIVGHNGSGKSTMLKLLTGIMAPTRGTVRVRGRIGALIEVGAGFHPDLTGRENVFLCGSILGMSRREIAQKLDQIVSFAELEAFLDTPVKRYSSGMYMRLGFSVIAHTNPELLIVDEVLAVGDAAFQEKCMNRIRAISAQGATVVFVTHSMGAVEKLCSRAILLNAGQLIADGGTQSVCRQYELYMSGRIAARYLAEDEAAAAATAAAAAAAPQDDPEEHRGAAAASEGTGTPHAMPAMPEYRPPLRFTRVELVNEAGEVSRVYKAGGSLTIRMEYEADRNIRDCVVGVGINRIDGVVCYGPNTETDQVPLQVPTGRGRFEVTFSPLALLSETYTIAVAALEGETLLEYQEDLCRFIVQDDNHERGAVRMPHRWEHNIEAPHQATRTPLAAGGAKAEVVRLFSKQNELAP